MDNWVLILVRNNMAITREAIESVLAQSVPVRLLIINNGSTDGASSYINSLLGHDERVVAMHFQPGKGVAESWNTGLRYIWEQGAQHATVVNNDVILHPRAVELMLADGGDFVTCVGVRGQHYGERRDGVKVFKDNKGGEVFPGMPNPTTKRDHPDYSCWTMRKRVWDVVGEFDENFRCAFGEDADHHVRMHKAGVSAYCLDVPFLHYGSATINNALPRDARAIAEQAGRNRAYFREKWGCDVGSTEYYHGIFQTDAPGDDVPAMT